VRTFLVFLLAYTISQFFRAFLAVIAPELAGELGLTPADLGNISAIWFAAFAIAQFPLGLALDRIGPRRTVPLLMFGAVLGAFVFAQSTSGTGCLIGMGLIGLGCAPVYMGALYVFARAYEPRRFALLSSWLLGIGSGGNLLSTTPLAYAVREIGWRASFVAVAVITLISALLVFVVVRDPPRVMQPGARKSWPAEIAEIVSIRALWLLLPLTAVGYAIVAAERGLWIGPYLSEVHGLDPIARGNVVLIMAIAMSVGALAYGPLDQLFGTRKWVVFTGSLVTSFAFLALGTWPQPGVFATTAILATIGAAGMTYAVLMAHARPLFPEHLLGRGITFMNFVFIGGAGLIQLLSGAYVHSSRAAAASAAALYAQLHLAFALTLLATTALYAFSYERR
jgi:MFS family permease